MAKKAAKKKASKQVGRGEKYARLKALGQERLDEVTQMLTRGVSPWQVAKRIQEEWKQHTDVNAHTLGRMLERYRQDYVPDLDVVEAADPQTATNAMKRLQKHANVLDEFSELISLQMDRVKMLHKREKQVQMPMQMTDRTVETLGKLLRDYGNIALRVGIIQRGLDGGLLEGTLAERVYQKELMGAIDGMLEELHEDDEDDA